MIRIRARLYALSIVASLSISVRQPEPRAQANTDHRPGEGTGKPYPRVQASRRNTGKQSADITTKTQAGAVSQQQSTYYRRQQWPRLWAVATGFIEPVSQAGRQHGAEQQPKVHHRRNAGKQRVLERHRRIVPLTELKLRHVYADGFKPVSYTH